MGQRRPPWRRGLPRLRRPARTGTLAVATRSSVLPARPADDGRGDRHLRRRARAGVAPLSVTLRLADDLDVSRGDLISRPSDAAGGRRASSRRRSAGWPTARCGRRTACCASTRRVRCRRSSTELRDRIDVDTLERETGVEALALNDIGRVRLRTSTPLVFDPYLRNRSTGSFILIDEATNGTVAGGMIDGPADAA